MKILKKIIIRNDLITGGGVENVMYNLIMYMLKRDYDITVVTDSGTSDEFYNIFPREVKFIRSSYNRKKTRRATPQWVIDRTKYLLYRAYFGLQLQKKFDIAIAMKEGHSMMAVSKMRTIKKYAWVHVDYDAHYWTKYVFPGPEEERKCMSNFDQVICVSNATMKSVKHVIGDPGNLCVRYNPINYIEIRKKAEEFPNFNRPQKKLLFVAVGRLSEQKNYLMLLDVFCKLGKRYGNNIELWIVGEGKQRRELEEKIEKSGISCIKLLGERKNPYPIIKMADCVISASKWESYGLAIQEAFILGIPVVATKCPALEEIFDHRFGILTENTETGLLQALIEIMQNTEILKRYRENIKQLYDFESLYTQRMNKICDLWEQGYE